MDPSLFEGVALTALIIAQARANESSRANRLVDDPFAQAFIVAAGAAFPAGSPGIAGLLRLRGDYIAIRTRFFDDYLLDACHAGCSQVVLLAAGLDARAFRLAWPKAVEIYELDLPNVLAFKESVLTARSAKPACRRVVVPADLSEDWPKALLASGFLPSRPTAWLLEGILMYLPEDKREELLDRIGTFSAPGSRLALDQRGTAKPTDDPLAGPAHVERQGNTPLIEGQAVEDTDAAAAHLGVRIPGANPDASVADPEGWLSNQGWHAQLYNAVERFAFYDREVEQPVRAAAGELWLATAERY